LFPQFVSDWFDLSEREQQQVAVEVGELQRKLPFWVAREVMRGVKFDDVYGLASLQHSSSSKSCVWACESEEEDAVCFDLHDEDHWFRCVSVWHAKCSCWRVTSFLLV
jgi:hypothetical protein